MEIEIKVEFDDATFVANHKTNGGFLNIKEEGVKPTAAQQTQINKATQSIERVKQLFDARPRIGDAALGATFDFKTNDEESALSSKYEVSLDFCRVDNQPDTSNVDGYSASMAGYLKAIVDLFAPKSKQMFSADGCAYSGSTLYMESLKDFDMALECAAKKLNIQDRQASVA